jgi:hypothetical protein
VSYSFTVQVREGDDAEAACLEAFDRVKQHVSAEYAAEVAEHVKAIAFAVGAILDSHALGEERLVNVSISGHAEPGHVKRDGWSQDSMSIRLDQVQEEPAAASDPAED